MQSKLLVTFVKRNEMDTLKELKDLLISIAGGDQTDFEVISNIKDSIADLKKLVNAYSPDIPKPELKDLMVKFACLCSPFIFDKENFSINQEDIDTFVDYNGNSCIDGFPTLFSTHKGQLYGDEVVEVGCEEGIPYIVREYDGKTKRIPAKYREYLTDYLSNAIDAITLGKVCKRSY